MGAFELTAFEETAFDVDVPLDAITISPSFVLNLMVGGSPQQLAATAEFADSSTQDVTEVAGWSSADPEVVSVSAAGVVLGVSTGSTEITATYGGLSTTIPVAALVVLDHAAAAVARLPNIWQ